MSSDPPHGSLFSLTDTTQFTLNDSGVLIIRGTRKHSDGSLPDDQSFWRNADGQLSLILRDGDPAPGPEGDATFSYIQCVFAQAMERRQVRLPKR